MLSAKRQLNKYGSKGTLKIPVSNGVFDPTTGDATVLYEDYDIIYIPYPVSSEDLNNFGLTAFDGSFISFMPTNTDVSTLEVRPNSFIDDSAGNRWDIQNTQPVLVKDKIILFQATTKVKR